MECEEFPDDSDWENPQLTERIISMTKKLLEGIEKGYIASMCVKISMFYI